MSVQINLSPATASDTQSALDEVKDFDVTDMGRGGLQRWTYRVMEEPALSQELRRLANPKTHGTVDSVTFQPCPSFKSQDRYHVEHWSLPNGVWTFTAIFDGHMNGETAQHVVQTLPSTIRISLESQLRAAPQKSLPPEHVSALLSQAVINFDNSMISEMTQLFPGGRLFVPGVHEDVMKAHINDRSSEGRYYQKIARALGGCTAILALTNPKEEDLWLANLGDSCAVLCQRSNGGGWSGTLLNAIHNGNRAQETSRIASEHPNEDACMHHDRVVGFLAPTRAIGDAWLKIPTDYTRQILASLEADWLEQHRLEEYLHNVLTPPYVSNRPDVYHHRLSRDKATPPTPRFLIMCSDGLSDLYGSRLEEELANEWAALVGQELDRGGPNNLALHLLRDGLGGNDTRRVSRNLTVEMEDKWMDDTTIVVRRFL